MAHAQKPHFVFPRKGRVHLNRWGLQFNRPLAAEVCASALVMLDRPRSQMAWEYWLPTPFASFLFTSPPVRHRVSPGSERALQPVVVTVQALHIRLDPIRSDQTQTEVTLSHSKSTQTDSSTQRCVFDCTVWKLHMGQTG